MYADDSDLTARPLPDNTLRLIRKASGMVEHATRMSLYEVDSEGYPVEERVLEAFNEATVAHVDAMIEAGAHKSPELIESAESFGGASKTYINAGEVAGTASMLRSTLCAEAIMILRNEGLIDGQPVLW